MTGENRKLDDVLNELAQDIERLRRQQRARVWQRASRRMSAEDWMRIRAAADDVVAPRPSPYPDAITVETHDVDR